MPSLVGIALVKLVIILSAEEIYEFLIVGCLARNSLLNIFTIQRNTVIFSSSRKEIMRKIELIVFVLLGCLYGTTAFCPSTSLSQTYSQAKSSLEVDPYMTSHSKYNPSLFMSKDDANVPKRISRRKRLKKKAKTFAFSLALYSTILTRTPKAAYADHPLQNVPSGKISLRPGITVEQIEMEAERRGEQTIDEQIESQYEKQSSTTTDKKATTKKAEKKASKFDFDDEYDFDEEEDDAGEISFSTGSSASAKTLDVENSGSARSITRFSGSGPALSEQKKSSEINKTVVKIMSPIFAFCFARETIRWNREQKNVDKGIDIMEQQRQEYLKSKQEGDDDDDDDDDYDVSKPQCIFQSIVLRNVHSSYSYVSIG